MSPVFPHHLEAEFDADRTKYAGLIGSHWLIYT